MIRCITLAKYSSEHTTKRKLQSPTRKYRTMKGYARIHSMPTSKRLGFAEHWHRLEVNSAARISVRKLFSRTTTENPSVDHCVETGSLI